MNSLHTLAWMVSGSTSACPICRERRPRDVIAELEATWVTAPVRAPLPGYACLVAKRHVVEPFELPPDEMAAFFAEAMGAARVVADAFRPAKMNYEIHGNTIPHLHMHLYPRFPGDPFEGGPIDADRAAFERSAEDLRRLGAAVSAWFTGQ